MESGAMTAAEVRADVRDVRESCWNAVTGKGEYTPQDYAKARRFVQAAEERGASHDTITQALKAMDLPNPRRPKGVFPYKMGVADFKKSMHAIAEEVIREQYAKWANKAAAASSDEPVPDLPFTIALAEPRRGGRRHLCAMPSRGEAPSLRAELRLGNPYGK